MVSVPTILLTDATNAVGLELARRYHRRGAELVLLGRQPIERLPDDPFAAHRYLACDLVRPDCGAEVASFLAATDVGGLDLLIHNAACRISGDFVHQPESALCEQLAVELYAPLILSHALLPLLRRRRGKIVFLVSIAADWPTPDAPVTSATQAAVAAFARNLRIELAPDVRVQVIYLRSQEAASGDRQERRQRLTEQLERAIAGRAAVRTLGLGPALQRAAGRYLAGPVEGLGVERGRR